MSPSPISPSPEARLIELGISLPTPAAPVAAYVPAKRAGSLLYISGQIPLRDGQLISRGVVGRDIDLAGAQAAARQCALNALAAIRVAAGSLDAVAQVVRLGVFVACTPEFVDHPKVANGASELFQSVFGESGRHARAAVGAPSLPLGATVEVEVLVELRG
jgi:enamine deaminase RidA (YjgF/YER057c/UK114 family)